MTDKEVVYIKVYTKCSRCNGKGEIEVVNYERPMCAISLKTKHLAGEYVEIIKCLECEDGYVPKYIKRRK